MTSALRPPAAAQRGRVLALLAVAIVLWALLYAGNEWVWTPVLAGLGLDLGSRLGDAVRFFLYDTVKILLLLTGLVFAVGLLRTAVSAERVREVISGRRTSTALVLAALLGAVTPFCSCSSIPLFIGFVAAGVPLGVTMTFLIASPLVNEVAVVMMAGLFGWQYTVIYVGAGLALAIGAGALLTKLDLERWVEPFVFATPVARLTAGGGALGLAERVQAARDETVDIVRKVWPYVLVGIGLGAAIHGWVPESFFATYAGSNAPFAVVVATVVGVPLYSNAAGVIPLAEALWDKGMALGTVMAFMMSVVALSVPSLVLLRRVLKPPLLALFTGTVAAGILLIGVLLNLVS
jgi:uncharacterized protein